MAQFCRADWNTKIGDNLPKVTLLVGGTTGLQTQVCLMPGPPVKGLDTTALAPKEIFEEPGYILCS